jgi:UDPglucose--hexose-1-phosphate uridylyltransferase
MASGPGPELRQDPLSNEWVIVAPGRARRPGEVAIPTTACPFCPGNEALTPPSLLLLQDEGAADAWFVRVVENLFPVVAGEGRHPRTFEDASFRSTQAVGAHEVVIETPHHDQEMALRGPAQLALSLRAYQDRLSTLMARDDIRYVVAFKNRGAEAGTSLPHPHSQIIGLARVPQSVRRRVQRARRHFRASGICLLCDLVQAERHKGGRVILDQDGFFAFAPFAQSVAGQILLVPLHHSPSLAAASEAEIAAMSRCLQLLLSKIDAALDRPPFNLILHEAPKPWRLDPALHWYWELIPRLTKLGGFELATGMSVNALSPEVFVRDLIGRA